MKLNKKAIVAKFEASIAAMPKCPTCGGFAIPSTEHSANKAFVCTDHGRFVPKGRS